MKSRPSTTLSWRRSNLHFLIYPINPAGKECFSFPAFFQEENTMDARMHRKTSEWACRHASGELWRKYLSQISDASTYPDAYVFGEDAEDKTGWDPDWRELVLIPHQGRLTPMHRIYETVNLRQTYPEVVRYLVHLSLSAFRAGNEELAAKAAGVLTHLSGDTFQVAHTTDNRMVLQMYPFRPNERFMIHAYMEDVLCDIDPGEDGYQPRLLAADEDGLVWRIVEELEIGRVNSVAEIPIIMDALRSGDQETAVASATRSATACAKLNADIFHTINALITAAPQPEPALRLTDLVRADVASDNMFNYEAMFDYLPGQTWENSTQLDVGLGGTWGLSVLPMMAQSYRGLRDAWITYSVDGCGYSHFRCQVGIQHFHQDSEIPFHSRGNETSCIFELRLDGRTVYRSRPLSDQDEPETAEIPLENARELTLYVRDVRDPNPLTRFVYPVFAKPELVR